MKALEIYPGEMGPRDEGFGSPIPFSPNFESSEGARAAAREFAGRQGGFYLADA